MHFYSIHDIAEYNLTAKIILKSQNAMGDRRSKLLIQNFLVIKTPESAKSWYNLNKKPCQCKGLVIINGRGDLV